MIERQLVEYKDSRILRITLDGFFDYEEFSEAVRVMKEEIGVDFADFTSGWESSTGITKKDGIELKWTFSNWDCIQFEYENPKDEASIETVRQWAKTIYNNLMEKFGPQ